MGFLGISLTGSTLVARFGMAYVYRKKSPRGKSLPTYYCAFRVPADDGVSKKHVHRNTECRTKAEAEKAARRFEEEALREAGAGDEMSAAILAKVKEAGELAMRGRLNPSHARRIIGEIMELQPEGEALAEFTVRGWIEDWLKEKEATTSPATVQFYRSTTKLFLEFLNGKADCHLESITSRDIRNFRDSIREAGRAAKTANHKLKALRSLFGDAVKQAAILQNPALAVKPLDETDSVPREPFSPTEVAKLVKAVPSEEWRGVILLGAYAGLRLGDASQLKAGNIDLSKGLIRFTPSKSRRKGTVIEIPMHSELDAHFKRNKPSPFDAAFLFPTLAEFKTGCRGGLSEQFRDIMTAAGIERFLTRRTKDGAARDTAKRSFHSLRHTFTSWLANASVPEEVRRKMTGHTSTATHQQYTHHELRTLKGAVEKLPPLNGKKKRNQSKKRNGRAS